MIINDQVRANFCALVDASAGDAGCWHWKGSRENGVPLFRFEMQGEAVDARVVSHALGAWPDGQEYSLSSVLGSFVTAENSCGTEGCVNPEHLSW